MSRLKVLTIIGTRPEIIRLSSVMKRLDRTVDHKIAHTGQNYDFELNEIFFAELGLRKPDHFMGVDTSSLGATLGGILIETEKVLKAERPDAVLILGDTNSAIAAIMARRMKIPVYHMEAGNRCFDLNVPEETNRRLVDHVADFNLVYTEHARRHLLTEGLAHRRIYLTGSPMREVLETFRARIEAADVLERHDLTPRGFFIVSLHREENVDSPDRLITLVNALNGLADRFGLPVIVSTHPRTRKRLDALEDAEIDPRVQYMKPFGFIDYNCLQKNAFCAISDSGTITEESAILSFPAVTPRESIERPEGMDTGAIIMSGLEAASLTEAVDAAVRGFEERMSHGSTAVVPEDYRIPNTSERVVNLILSTARQSNAWDGIRPPATTQVFDRGV